MSNHLKLRITLWSTIITLIPLSLIAQNKAVVPNALNAQQKNLIQRTDDILKIVHVIAHVENGIIEEYRSQIFDYCSEGGDFATPPRALPKCIAESVIKMEITEEVLDSVIYHYEGRTYKRSYTYDNNMKRLTHLEEIWNLNKGIWVKNWRESSTYDNGGNELTKSRENWLLEDWHTGAGIWENDWRNTYSYGESGNKLGGLEENWDQFAEIWVNNSRFTLNISGGDSGTTVIRRVDEKWDANAGTWLNDSRDTIIVGVHGMLCILEETWDDIAGAWVNHSRWSFVYSSSGMLLAQSMETWNSTVEAWVYDWRYTSTYDDIRDLITSSESWYYASGILVRHSRLSYTYDDVGNTLTVVQEDWDNYTEIWILDSRISSAYDGRGNILSKLQEDWDDYAGIWVNDNRHTYTYNENGNKLTAVWETWKKYPGAWENYWREIYIYDDRENLIYFRYENWSNPYYDNGSCSIRDNNYYYSFDCSELTAYYSSPAAVFNPPHSTLLSYSLSQNFPNPFNPATTIKYTLPKTSTVTLTIYNLAGQEVVTLVNEVQTAGEYEVHWDARSFPNAVYICRMRAGEFVATRRLIVLR